MSNPLVSVVMPVLNAESYLDLAIASILTQSYREIELICIDDGSTDASPDIIARASSQDHRVKFHSRENRGLVATLNEGFGYAEGTFIARMDADDIAYEHRLSKQVSFLKDNIAVDLLGTSADYLFPDGRLVRKNTSAVGGEALRIEALFHCVFVHPSVMFRRPPAGVDMWRYDPLYPYCEDFELWSRILREKQGAILPRPELAWRQGHSSVRSTKSKQMTVDSLRNVATNLGFHGHSLNTQCFLPFLEASHAVTPADREHLTEELSGLVGLRRTFHRTPEAFNRGIKALMLNVIRSAATVGQLRPLLNAIPSNLLADLSWRERANVYLWSIDSNNRMSNLTDNMRSMHRYVYGKSLKRLPDLAPSISHMLDTRNT